MNLSFQRSVFECLLPSKFRPRCRKFAIIATIFRKTMFLFRHLPESVDINFFLICTYLTTNPHLVPTRSIMLWQVSFRKRRLHAGWNNTSLIGLTHTFFRFLMLESTRITSCCLILLLAILRYPCRKISFRFRLLATFTIPLTFFLNVQSTLYIYLDQYRRCLYAEHASTHLE